MKPAATIDVALSCAAWVRRCPAARQLARETARRTLADGLAALRLAPTTAVELGITLTDAAEQQRLNREYRGQDAPTNVLAFPAWEPQDVAAAEAPLLLGDVTLALETVLREAAEQGKAVGDHLSHLVAHGVLHLLGFDHRTDTDAGVMEALETSILAKLGIADPYRDPAWPPDSGSP